MEEKSTKDLDLPSVADDKSRDKIVILSGGMDSVTLLHDYADEVRLAITFDYGANHAANEIKWAKYHCDLLGIPHRVIPMDFIKADFKSSLLEGADAIPDADYALDNLKSTVVPFRNGIMIAIAAGYAESLGATTVMLANHAGDHAIYPDCTPQFIDAMNDAVLAGTYNDVRLYAPYTHLSKSDIVAIGVKLGIDYDTTWSCYKGGDKPCGECATCREREQAFRDNGLLK